ncbi:TonB-dependent receptor [Phenylobacterium terrae]|uniref:TonB-dependent receptor n=1 Tax=Phenylobacterium terrae TaxID=2665495 RepID=A0ABW4MVB0_9CAUL
MFHAGLRGRSAARARTLLLAGAAASALWLPQVASAQATVEELVVTAQRREENLQDTPVAVTAFTAETMEARGVTNLEGVGNYTPNLELHQTNRPAGGGSAFAGYIRGVGTGDFQFPTDPGIGIYLDDVYLARSVGGLMSLEDIQRVEVLKGPQGTLFGRNTIGGAINIVTTRPKVSGDLDGVMKVRVGSYGRADFVAGVNGPIVQDFVGGKLTAAFLNSDGWSERVLTGEKGNDEHRFIVRGALLFDFAPGFEVTVNADYSEQNNNGVLGQLLNVLTSPTPPYPPPKTPRFNTFAAGAENLRLGLPAGSIIDGRWVSSDPYKNYGTQPIDDDYEIGGVSVVAAWDVNEALTLKSITAVRGIEAHVGVDGDQTPYSLQTSQTDLYQRQYSQELQAFGTAFDERLSWLVGLYAFEENGSSKLYTESYHGLWQNVPAAQRMASDAADTRTYFYSKTRSWALFTQETLRLTDALELTLGGRYTWEEKDYGYMLHATEVNSVRVPFSTDNQQWEAFTPKVGVNYRPAENILLYGSYSQGFKSGGWGGSTTALVPTPRYEPEEVSTWELGAKTDWFDRRLVANLAVFWSDYEDIQLTVQTRDPVTGANLRTTQNSGDADIAGFEFEATAIPVEDLTLNLGVGYVDAEFSSLSADARALTDPFNRPNAVKVGDPIPQIPEWSINAGAQYVARTGVGDLTFRVDAAHKGDQFLTLGDPTSFQGAYTLWNAQIAFRPSAIEGLELSINGTNLTDEVYYAYHATLPPTGQEVALPVAPRLIYATAKFEF